MALNFLRKVFSFGAKPEEPKPEPLPIPPTEPEKVPDTAPEPARPAEPVEPAKPPLEIPPQPEPAPPATPDPDSDPHPDVPHDPPLEAPPAEPVEVPEPVPVEVPQEKPAEIPSTPVEAPPAASPLEIPAQTVPEAFAPAPHPYPLPVKDGERGSPTSRPPSPRPSRGEGKGEGQRVTVAKSVERKADSAPVAPAEPARKTWVQRLREGLSRSSRELTSGIAGVFTRRKLDDDTLEELEEVLIRADLGMETAIRVTGALSAGRFGRDISDAEVRQVMAAEVEKVLAPVALPLELDLSHKPHVILVVGVNGTGKTTTIGKLAAKLTRGGLKVMLAAGDTFRAAAIEQLKIWGERTGSPVVSSKLGADAAGLAFEAFQKAREAGSDVLIIDTAGRLQNKAELMAELEKIVRVLGKHDPEAPHTVLQTVDATTGQNAMNQVEIFRNVAGVNGLVMTKLDGTARGGILVAIAAKHRLPVYFIGVGEQVDDLEPFDAGDFAKAIAGVA
ncbi:MAG: signal recognition particle-docking protein FtsY [Rhizobiaceae bacterium]|nr:signal recognition particle-docking protein FtsY [Rhizobiaceae bacterium]